MVGAIEASAVRAEADGYGGLVGGLAPLVVTADAYVLHRVVDGLELGGEPLALQPLQRQVAVAAVEARRRPVRVVRHADGVVQAHHDGARAALAGALGRTA